MEDMNGCTVGRLRSLIDEAGDDCRVVYAKDLPDDFKDSCIGGIAFGDGFLIIKEPEDKG